MRKLHLTLLLVGLMTFSEASFAQINFSSYGHFLAIDVKNHSGRTMDGLLIQYGDNDYLKWDTLRLNNRHIDINGDTIINTGYKPIRWFTDTINSADSRKASNSGETFGILRHGIWQQYSLSGPDVITPDSDVPLGIEQCSYIGNESRYGSFYNNDTFPIQALKLGAYDTSYQLWIFVNLPAGYVAKLEDALGPGRALSSVDTTMTPQKYLFTVNGSDAAGAGTKIPNRFRLVVSNNASFTPRFAFNHFGAVRDPRGIHMNWDVLGESMVSSYEIQTLEQKDFVTVGIVDPITHAYAYPEYAITEKTIRIKANLVGDKVAYSDTIKLDAVLAGQPFRLLPNTTSSNSSITLQFDRPSYGQTELVIVNIAGQPVLRKSIIAQTGERITLRNLSPGLYLVKVGTMLQKLVVQ